MNNLANISAAGGPVGDPRVWVILPTYNEADNLPQMLVALGDLDLDLDVVVVDDASPDGTGEIAVQAASRNSRVHVIRREGERGLGAAYLAGFRYALAAGADAVITMDCDFSHDPRAIPAMVAALESAQVVVGSRYIPGGRTENWGLHRKILSAAANRFARALFHMPVRDCTSGFRLYSSDVLESVLEGRVHSTGYAFLVEILHLTTRKQGVTVEEVPICFVDRERGSGKMGMREVIDGVTNLLQLRAEMSSWSSDGENAGRGGSENSQPDE
ncbi:MAG TPA: polyprenol monophosphomannose synthase [Pyrinomonadaceae bacterium]|nr:polyprenol monophosphomannose synthase [Pyrinomonadaceae bacterium]